MFNLFEEAVFILVILLQVVQQWPPQQTVMVSDGEEDNEDIAGINVEAAKERLRREDEEFDKIEHRRKIKERHRVSLNTFLSSPIHLHLNFYCMARAWQCFYYFFFIMLQMKHLF